MSLASALAKPYDWPPWHSWIIRRKLQVEYLIIKENAIEIPYRTASAASASGLL
jgi:hypothetical protein